MLEAVDRVRLLSLAGDFATCTERSRGPVHRLGNMFETRRRTALLGAHGLAFLVELTRGRDSATALFDCGLRGDVLADNVRYLGLDLGRARAIFLSHGHPDHYGGLPAALDLVVQNGGTPVPVVLHEAAFRERCWAWPDHRGGRYRLSRSAVRSPKARVVLQSGPGLVLDGRALFLTDIPRLTSYERRRPGGQVLYRAGRGWRVDSTPDDAALVMHLDGRGLVILTGCGHAGLVNTVREAVERSGVPRVHAVVGGFHLCHAPARRIAATIRDLRGYRPRWVVPSHCSGLEFEAALRDAFPQGFALDSVGTEYVWTAAGRRGAASRSGRRARGPSAVTRREPRRSAGSRRRRAR